MLLKAAATASLPCYQRVHQEPWRPPAERPLAITTVLRTMACDADHAFEAGATPAVLLAPSMKFYGFPLEALGEGATGVQMVSEERGASLLVGESHPYDLVEAPGAAQRRTDVVGAVGGPQDEDLPTGLEGSAFVRTSFVASAGPMTSR